MNGGLEDIIRQEVETLGFDVVEVRRGGTARRPVFDVRIDRRDDERVSVADCALVSRALEPRLESLRMPSESWVLEVSSPGVERPLRSVADWRRFTGRSANVLSPSLGGRMEVEVIGVDEVPGEEAAFVRDARGVEHRIRLADVKDARLVFRWNK